MKETIEFIKELILRDLDRLKMEIESFKEESNLWVVSGEVSNTSGNLCLHLCGNLKHFIGAEMGNTGYIRMRDDEFNLKNVTRADLLNNIQETCEVVGSTLDAMDTKLFSEKSSTERIGKKMTNHAFLIYLIGHLNYHIGQINYQRRLVD